MSIFSSIKKAVSSVYYGAKEYISLSRPPDAYYDLGTGTATGGLSSGTSTYAEGTTFTSNTPTGSTSTFTSSGGGGGGGTSGGTITQDLSPTITTQTEITQARISGGLTDLQKYQASRSGGGQTFLQDIKELGTDISRPFVDTVKGFYEGASGFVSKKTKEKVGGYGKKATTSISDIEQKAIEKIIPSEKDKRLEQEKFSDKVTNLDARINTFNQKYGGKELSEEEYNQAIQEQTQFQKAVNLLEQEQRYKEQRDKALKKAGAFEGDPATAFVLGLVKGGVSAPFELGKFGVGIVTDPLKTIEETVTGLSDIPAQFVAEPFYTTGELLGTFAVQSAILGGIGRGGRALRDMPETELILRSPKLDSTLKTPLEKTFATDMRVWFGDEPIGMKVKLYKPSQSGLKRLKERMKLESATSKLLKDVDINRFMGELSRRPTPQKSPQVRALEVFKQQQRIERALEKSPVGRGMALEEELKRMKDLDETIKKAGLEKPKIFEPTELHLKAIEKVKESERVEKAKSRALGDDFKEAVDYVKGLQEVRDFLGEVRTIKPSEAGLKAVEKVKTEGRIERAKEFRLEEVNQEELANYLKGLKDIRKSLGEIEPIKMAEASKVTLEKLRREELKKSKQYKPIKFDVDLSDVKRRLNILKEEKKVVTIDKDLNVRFREQEPRFKTPTRIKRLRKPQQPSVQYRPIDEIPDEIKGEVQTQKSGQQQQLVRQEQIQKQIQQTEPIQQVKILSERQLQRLRNKQRQIEKQKLKQRQRQASRQQELEPLRQKSVSMAKQRLVSPFLVRELEREMQGSSELQLQKFTQKQGQPELAKPLLKSEQAIKQAVAQAQAVRDVLAEPSLLKQITEIIRPKLFRISKKKTQEQKPLGKESYNVYVKVPQRKTYSKITKKPIALREAENLRNYALDKSTSRTGFLKRTKQKPSPSQFDIPPTYERNTSFKFRQYSQKKGKRISLQKGKVIEKSRYLLDEPEEVRDINVFKLLAQRERKRQLKQKMNKPIWEMA